MRVRLVAVSKTFEAADIVPVIEAGQRFFGENRVQEAKRKWPELRARDTRYRAASDRSAADQQGGGSGGVVRRDPERRPAEACAMSLAKEIEKQGRRPELFIQVNTGEEAQKAGNRFRARPTISSRSADRDSAFAGCRAHVHPAGR